MSLRLSGDRTPFQNRRTIDLAGESFSKVQGVMGLVYADIELNPKRQELTLPPARSCLAEKYMKQRA